MSMCQESSNVYCSICYAITGEGPTYGFNECFLFHNFCQHCFVQIQNDCPCDGVPIATTLLRSGQGGFDKIDRQVALGAAYKNLFRSFLTANMGVIKSCLKSTINIVYHLVSTTSCDQACSQQIGKYPHLYSISRMNSPVKESRNLNEKYLDKMTKELKEFPNFIYLRGVKSFISMIIHNFRVLSSMTLDDLESSLQILDWTIFKLKMGMIQVPILGRDEYSMVFCHLEDDNEWKCLICFEDVCVESAEYEFGTCPHRICENCIEKYEKCELRNKFDPSCPLCD